MAMEQTAKLASDARPRGRLIVLPRKPKQIADAERKLLAAKKQRALRALCSGIALLALPAGFVVAALVAPDAGSFPLTVPLAALCVGIAFGSRLLDRALRERRELDLRIAALADDIRRLELRTTARRRHAAHRAMGSSPFSLGCTRSGRPGGSVDGDCGAIESTNATRKPARGGDDAAAARWYPYRG